MTTKAPRRRIAVIGAGSGGVNVAKHLIAAGHDVTVFEAGSYIGGLWKYENDNGRSQAYKHLCIITPRGKTQFPDFPFGPDTPRFPTHWDMYRYFCDYAEHFGVTERIRFHTKVTSVEPVSINDPAAPRWQVAYDGGCEEFDGVVVATGHLNEPNHSDFLRGFGGEYLHSGSYRVADGFVGKRVCVAGTGNSGVDVASDVCGVAERVVLVARSGLRIQPKVVFGIAYPDIAIGLRKPWMPGRLLGWILRSLTFLAHGDQSRLGFGPPLGRQHPTSSESIVSHIEFNRVEVKPGIKSISDKVITFEDGSEEEFDVMVAATGYQVYLPFLSDQVLPIEGNRVDLYKRIFPVGLPGLYFVGMLNPLLAYSQVFEAQSKVIVQAVEGGIDFPSAAEMRAEIEAGRAVAAAMYTDSPRHELEEPDTNYPYTLRDFQRDSRLRRRFGGRIPFPLTSRRVRAVYWRISDRAAS